MKAITFPFEKVDETVQRRTSRGVLGGVREPILIIWGRVRCSFPVALVHIMLISSAKCPAQFFVFICPPVYPTAHQDSGTDPNR